MWLPFVLACAVGAEPIQFERHVIDTYPAGYQVAVADMNGDARPDVLALSTEADRVDWFENPGWQPHPVARTAKNIDLAVRDLNNDGHPVIALASGFYFSESTRGGEIQLLRPPDTPGELWQQQPIAVDPVVHRLRWGDLDGDKRPELIHAPIFGAGSNGPKTPNPAHLWAFRMPQQGGNQPWEVCNKWGLSLFIMEDRRDAHRVARHPGDRPRRERPRRHPHRKLRGHPSFRFRGPRRRGLLAKSATGRRRAAAQR